MSPITKIAGSFRDPAGSVHEIQGRIFRTVTAFGAKNFEGVVETGFLEELIESGDLLPYEIVKDPSILEMFPDEAYVLEHPKISYISFPYEWSFSSLKSAALLHLDIALRGLDAGVTLSDATAYNIQFIGPKPVFIDHLSFKPYSPREYWTGHRQFCEQFLNPLLLRSKFGITHNSWFRGSPEGISNQDIAAMLRFHQKLSLKMQAHVVLPARFQARASGSKGNTSKPIEERKGLPLASYKGLLRQLQGWISSLKPKDDRGSVWGKYADTNTYEEDENAEKISFVEKFTRARKPGLVYDLGCNSGAFSEVALHSGASQVIGFDFDQIALEKAHARASDKSLNLLALHLDASNPSPNQGWQQSERPGFNERAAPDAVFALAFEHHLAIAKNIPLPDVVGWITSLAPSGIIEFVRKSDPTIKEMLSLREDIFADYTQQAFEQALEQNAAIIESKEITQDGRTLYWYERSN